MPEEKAKEPGLVSNVLRFIGWWLVTSFVVEAFGVLFRTGYTYFEFGEFPIQRHTYHALLTVIACPIAAIIWNLEKSVMAKG